MAYTGRNFKDTKPQASQPASLSVASVAAPNKITANSQADAIKKVGGDFAAFDTAGMTPEQIRATKMVQQAFAINPNAMNNNTSALRSDIQNKANELQGTLANIEASNQNKTEPVKTENKDTELSNIESSLNSELDSINKSYESDLNYFKNTLAANEALRSASQNNLLNSINKIYENRINTMKDLNERYLGGKTQLGFVSGRARYNPAENMGILQKEEIDGIQRIGEIEAEQLMMITEAEQAYQKNELTAFYDKMNYLQDLAGQKNEQVKALYQKALDFEKQALDRMKEERAAAKADFDMSLELSEKLAPTIFENINTENMTPDEKALVIEEYASKYGVDPSLLISAITTYSNEQEMDSLEKRKKMLEMSNIESQIQSRKNTDYIANEKFKMDKEGKSKELKRPEFKTFKDEQYISDEYLNVKNDIKQYVSVGFSDNKGNQYPGLTGGFIAVPTYISIYNSLKNAGDPKMLADFFMEYPPEQWLNPNEQEVNKLPPEIKSRL